MRVKIRGLNDDLWFDAQDIPIALELSEMDKKSIGFLASGQSVYCPHHDFDGVHEWIRKEAAAKKEVEKKTTKKK